MEVRWATIFDFSHICAMLTTMHAESEIELGSISPKKLSEVVLRTINDGAVLVALDDGKIIGILTISNQFIYTLYVVYSFKHLK